MNVGVSSVGGMVRDVLDKHQPTVNEGVPVLFNESKPRILNQTRQIVKVRWALFIDLEENKRLRRSSHRIMICRGWLGRSAIPITELGGP